MIPLSFLGLGGDASQGLIMLVDGGTLYARIHQVSVWEKKRNLVCHIMV
jgi:hypothetical protein